MSIFVIEICDCFVDIILGKCIDCLYYEGGLVFN